MSGDHCRPWAAAFSSTRNPIFRFFGSGSAISCRTAANSVLIFESCAVTARSNSSNLIRTSFCSRTDSDWELRRFGNSRNVEMQFTQASPPFSSPTLTFSLFLPSGRSTLSVRRRESMDSRRYSRPYLIVPYPRMRPSLSKLLLLWRHPRYRLWLI